MTAAAAARARESQRIALLVERDGLEAARGWVERTRRIYADALSDPRSHAWSAHYRPSFEGSIEAFDDWLRRHGANGSRGGV